jgi:hypothetical protein
MPGSDGLFLSRFGAGSQFLEPVEYDAYLCGSFLFAPNQDEASIVGGHIVAGKGRQSAFVIPLEKKAGAACDKSRVCGNGGGILLPER